MFMTRYCAFWQPLDASSFNLVKSVMDKVETLENGPNWAAIGLSIISGSFKNARYSFSVLIWISQTYHFWKLPTHNMNPRNGNYEQFTWYLEIVFKRCTNEKKSQNPWIFGNPVSIHVYCAVVNRRAFKILYDRPPKSPID